MCNLFKIFKKQKSVNDIKVNQPEVIEQPQEEVMSKHLTEADYQYAASIIGCDVAVIKAVSFVESGGRSGFLKDGKTPKILFEGHWFHKLTKGRFTTSKNANISYPRWIRKYYNQDQHKRLQKAVDLDRDAALKSASWGKFQIMGFNYKLAGYDTLQDFINAMYKSEREHLIAFVNFVQHRRLDDELRRLDWQGFAYGYNGAGYAQNKYDEKLEKAYLKYKSL
ncbi:hypothetical protein FHS04_001233 [Mesoflavibacter sabulilitoris]|nr:N-acetylmuramidase family protein [Mesoflavibacter zeaxanthinifaciens]MBB3123730.1 hypothetical protein [Mesoflavibacter zeaxanthinifaciens subsp. sabulilitoris]